MLLSLAGVPLAVLKHLRDHAVVQSMELRISSDSSSSTHPGLLSLEQLCCDSWQQVLRVRR